MPFRFLPSTRVAVKASAVTIATLMSSNSASSRRKERFLGVCSWSLQADSREELVARIQACGVDGVQLALGPLSLPRFGVRETLEALTSAGIAVRSGMMSTQGEDYTSLDTIRHTGGVRPDEHWSANLAIAERDARSARALGVSLVTFHAGFLPHDRRDPERAKLIGRLRTIVDVFAAQDVRVGFETGQETADTLLDFLAELDRKTAGVNFDPANMILYGMGDPVAALRKLAPFVLQVHVKDAIAARTRGMWGEEVPVGTGQVDWAEFFRVLDAAQADIDLMIEREAGANRVADIRTARDLVRMSAARSARA
jgi:L-ribulose-5-phosphate 3-epimerase